VLHLTDPHLFADAEGSFRGTVTHASLSAVLADYVNDNWQADLVIVTGDLIQDDTAGAYEHFCALLAPLGLPVYCIPGNHDVRETMRAALAGPPFFYCDSFTGNDWLLTGIDSCAAGRAGGLVTEDELARLEALVKSTSAKHVMVCLHHPPVAMGSTWLDTVGLDNDEEFLRRVAALDKVRLAVFGHVHQPYDSQHGNIRVVGTPSTCRQFKPGSDEFAVDDRPPAYRRICLYADGHADCELVWVAHA
jgi:Icc protein